MKTYGPMAMAIAMAMAMAMEMVMEMVMVVAIARSLPHGPTAAPPHRLTDQGFRWGPLHVIGLISSWNWAAHFWASMRLAS